MDAAQANGVRETAHLECPICLPVTFLVAPPPTSMFHCVLLTQHGPVLGYARLAVDMCARLLEIILILMKMVATTSSYL